ncbi:MAG: right-handed parallel beta-helix repeat-containing protein [Anaerohalosphaeraceae bacterium]
MNTKFIIGIILSVGWLSFAGPLEPPAAPESTMKTLMEIEPRTPVEWLGGDPNTMFIIDQPGSYYLTNTIFADPMKPTCIAVNASGVVLDLNGFAIERLEGTLARTAIRIHGDDRRSVWIKNGSILNWVEGVIGPDADAITCTDLQIHCVYWGDWGIWLGDAVRVERCTVTSMVYGICAYQGQFSNCAAYQCGGRGYEVWQGGIITDCTARWCGEGIYGDQNCVIDRCMVSECFNRGINVDRQGQINHCSVRMTGKDYDQIGISAVAGNVISNCTVANCWAGIDAGDGNTIIDCTARGNGECGIGANAQNVIMRCDSSANDLWGIWVRDKTIVKDCVASNNGNAGIGIRCCGQGCRIESNICSGNTFGIQIENEANSHHHLIVKNTCGDNGTNYDLGSYSSWGPIIDLSSAYGDMSAIAGAEHPWANFEYSLVLAGTRPAKE